MKFLGKLILWLLVALLLVIIGAWFLLQTHWGARQASARLSNGTGWQVSFDEMEHDFSSPLHVQLRKSISKHLFLNQFRRPSAVAQYGV